MVTVIMACGSKEEVSTGTVNKILQNPNKVYSDQCYVWLKEMPDFFRERNYFADGHAWDRHSYQGIYVSENPKGLFYSRHYVGQTVLLFKPEEEGGSMSQKNMVYQYSISQGNDDNLVVGRILSSEKDSFTLNGSDFTVPCDFTFDIPVK